MASSELETRSRRAILTAAAGAAGALAAGALIPAGAAAADPNDVVMGQNNATTAATSVTNSTATTEPAADAVGAGTALGGYATGLGTGYGVLGTTVGDGTNVNPGGAGVIGWSTTAPDWVTPVFTSDATVLTGVFGFAPAGNHNTNAGSGVWGDSPDTGVLGTGGTGVAGYGFYGVYGEGNGNAHSVGVYAYAPVSTPTASALYVDGKAHFSRSGHTGVAKGKTSLKVTLAGTASSSKVFAVLASNASGRYVRAIVPTSGSFTVYFNTSLAAAAYVNWFVLD